MTNIKQYVRSGTLAQSKGYDIIMRFEGQPVDKVILVLEGRCRRKLELKPGRSLYENYYPLSFIGVEDYLLSSSYKGRAGVFPGSHYCIWQADDFYNSLNIHPELARHAIHELSRRVRLYDEKSGNETQGLRAELGTMDFDMNSGQVDEYISDMLLDLGFSNEFSQEDKFPPEMIQKFSRKFAPGEYLMKQGEKSLELYIILSGKVKVLHNSSDGTQKEDWLGAEDMVGEMAQFDGLPRSADVIATEETETLALAPEHFSLLFQLHSRWPMKILRTLAKRIEQRRAEFINVDMKSIK